MSNLEKLLNLATPRVKKAIEEIRKSIFLLGDDVQERFTSKMICYDTINKNNTGRKIRALFWFNLANGTFLRIHLRKNGNYPDLYNKIVPIGWGEYPELTFKEDELGSEQLEYIKDLARRSYQVQ